MTTANAAEELRRLARQAEGLAALVEHRDLPALVTARLLVDLDEIRARIDRHRDAIRATLTTPRTP